MTQRDATTVPASARGDGLSSSVAGDRAGDGPRSALLEHPAVSAALDLAHGPVLLLDRGQRVALAVRGRGLLLREVTDPAQDLWPGEALGCLQAERGLGCRMHCEGCGLARATACAAAGERPVACTCRLAVRRGSGSEILELRLRALRLLVGDEPYTLLTVADRSAERRRDEIDRVFLHDVSDGVGALLVWTHLLEARPTQAGKALRQITALATQLALAVEDQRVLLQAEIGRLVADSRRVEARAVLEEASRSLEGHPAAAGHSIETVVLGPAFELESDASLLARALAVLAHVALQAMCAGGPVRLTAERVGTGSEWRVYAPVAGICPELADEADLEGPTPLRVRRMRLHLSRLLVESYLRGELSCASSAEGTVFTVRLPA